MTISPYELGKLQKSSEGTAKASCARGPIRYTRTASGARLDPPVTGTLVYARTE